MIRRSSLKETCSPVGRYHLLHNRVVRVGAITERFSQCSCGQLYYRSNPLSVILCLKNFSGFKSFSYCSSFPLS